MYYQHMIRYYLHSHNYLEVTRCYKAMYESPLVAGEADKWKPVSGEAAGLTCMYAREGCV